MRLIHPTIFSFYKHSTQPTSLLFLPTSSNMRAMKKIIFTKEAPQAIGPYSQAVQHGNTIYFSGQIPLDPQTMNLVGDDIALQAKQVFANMQAVSLASGGSLQDIAKLTIYLVDLAHFSVVNDIMMQFFAAPYPARTTIQVSALPKNALVEIDAIMVL